MRRTPILLLVLALVAAPALAGCLNAPATVSAADAAAPSPDATGLTGRISYIGVETFEPTLGVAPDGAIYFSTTPVNGVAIGFGTGVHKSTDGGHTWTDVSPNLFGYRIPPETNDPYVYVDPGTGRVFQFAMAPILVCSILSWSDDGGDSWTTNPRGCGSPPPWDHQTMVAATPRETPTVGYDNVLVQCVNHGTQGLTSCARSLDGGFTFTPTSVIRDCSGLHGHLKAAPDGTIYLPKTDCGLALVHISEDDGVTWKRVPVYRGANLGTHEGAVAIDDAGNVYYAWLDEVGQMMLSVSTDRGYHWAPPVVASPPGVTVTHPAIAAGKAGSVVIAYAGTDDLPDGYMTDSDIVKGATWDAYMTITTNALDAAPTFDSVTGNDPADPIVRGACGPGRCPGLVDFIDVQVSPDGKAYAAFVDACVDDCVTDPEVGNNASEAILTTIENAPALR